MESKEIAFRAIYCYLLENEKRNKLNLDSILQKLDISELEAEQYRHQEMRDIYDAVIAARVYPYRLSPFFHGKP